MERARTARAVLCRCDRAFFDSGEADVEWLFATIGELAPATALDFGCGVGRLTLPLARRAGQVTGCDVSEEMVAEARSNASST